MGAEGLGITTEDGFMLLGVFLASYFVRMIRDFISGLACWV